MTTMGRWPTQPTMPPPSSRQRPAPFFQHLLLFLLLHIVLELIFRLWGWILPLEGAAEAGVFSAVYFTAFTLLLPRVAYRYRDVLMVLIPIYGCLVFVTRVLWRQVSPTAYWTPRSS